MGRESLLDGLSEAQIAVVMAVQKHCLEMGCDCRPGLTLDGDGSDARPFTATVSHKTGCGVGNG